MDQGEGAGAYSSDLARATAAPMLIAAAIAALAITGLVQSYQEATAQSSALAAPASAMPGTPPSAARDPAELGSFAFGHVEFDWNPAAPEGVPGFDSWPPGSRHR